MNTALLMRAGARVANGLGAAAGVIVADPALVRSALPPQAAGLVCLGAIVIANVMHELSHTISAPSATAPAAPAAPSQESIQ